jgi:hypothetical protein
MSKIPYKIIPKRAKVKMGGSVTRNGVNVDKEIEAQTKAKHLALKNKSK